MTAKRTIAVFGATGAQGGGLVRAIAEDATGPFAARAITRHPSSDKARALADLGVDVVGADADDPSTLAPALDGAYGAYVVTNFWEHLDADREGRQATAMARATKAAGVQHAVWSTLEDVREYVPLDDDRIPTLYGRFKSPHFDSKGAVDHVFASEAAPTTFMRVAFYWDNLVGLGMGPRRGDDGTLVLALPLGGAKLPGIASDDIGKCAYGIFTRGTSSVGSYVGIAGETLSGDEMAAKMGRALGETVRFYDVPFDVYRGLGFPGAEDLGNMFQFQQMFADAFYAQRDPKTSRELNPALLDFDAWLARNASRLATTPQG